MFQYVPNLLGPDPTDLIGSIDQIEAESFPGFYFALYTENVVLI